MTKRIDFQTFLARCSNKHGDQYDYSETLFVNMKTKIAYNCKKHGRCEQFPVPHLRTGCRRCEAYRRSRVLALTTEMFKAKAIQRHGDRYDYSLIQYEDQTDICLVVAVKNVDFVSGLASEGPTTRCGIPIDIL